MLEEICSVSAAVGTISAAHNSLCCWPIYHFGTEEQKMKYLPDLLKGKKIGAFGLTEPNAGSDAAGQQTRAHEEDGYYVLDGAKCFITNGGYADVFVCMAMTDKSKGNHGISAFIVEKGDPGFSIGKTEDKMGIHASSTTELIFTNCRIPKDRLLGNEGEGFKVAMQTLDGGRIGVAAQALGIASGAFKVTKDFIKTGTRDGVSLAKSQYVQFKMAEMATKIRAARLLILEAAERKDKDLPMGLNSSMAKLFAAETAMEVTTKAMDIFGDVGYVTGSPAERFFRDAKITEIYEGTSEIQKIVISSRVLKD
jgi:butyryl-CoA dehydrogenase